MTTMNPTDVRAAEKRIAECYRRAGEHDARAHEWRQEGEAAILATRHVLTARRQGELAKLSRQRIDQIRAGRDSAQATGVKFTNSQNGAT